MKTVSNLMANSVYLKVGGVFHALENTLKKRWRKNLGYSTSYDSVLEVINLTSGCTSVNAPEFTAIGASEQEVMDIFNAKKINENEFLHDLHMSKHHWVAKAVWARAIEYLLWAREENRSHAMQLALSLIVNSSREDRAKIANGYRFRFNMISDLERMVCSDSALAMNNILSFLNDEGFQKLLWSTQGRSIISFKGEDSLLAFLCKEERWMIQERAMNLLVESIVMAYKVSIFDGHRFLEASLAGVCADDIARSGILKDLFSSLISHSEVALISGVIDELGRKQILDREFSIEVVSNIYKHGYLCSANLTPAHEEVLNKVAELTACPYLSPDEILMEQFRNHARAKRTFSKIFLGKCTVDAGGPKDMLTLRQFDSLRSVDFAGGGVKIELALLAVRYGLADMYDMIPLYSGHPRFCELLSGSIKDGNAA